LCKQKSHLNLAVWEFECFHRYTLKESIIIFFFYCVQEKIRSVWDTLRFRFVNSEEYPAINSVYRDVELVCCEIVVYFLRVAVSFPRVWFLSFERRVAPHITRSHARHSVNLLTTIRATPSLIGERERGQRTVLYINW